MLGVIIDGQDKTKDLLERLLKEEPGAWRELVRGYSGLLVGVSIRTFKRYGAQGDGQDHEDVAAAVWGNLLENDKRVIRQCLERGGLTAVLHTLAKHRAVDLIRKKKLAVSIDDAAMGLEAPKETGGVSEEEREAMAAAVEALSDKQRALVRLYFLQEKSYREIQKLTGVPENSIGPTIKRAVEKLRELMGMK